MTANPQAAAHTATLSLRSILPTLAGLLFGIGLILSGMTDPQRVLGFLDLAGDWNPALALVMGGALAITLPSFAWVRRHQRTLLGEPLSPPDGRTLTPRLVIGAALFGIGWGLSGVCPGPAVLIAANGTWQPLLFLASLLAGAGAYERWSRRTAVEPKPVHDA